MNMDMAIQAAFPLLAVPRCGDVSPAASCGTRYLVASDGIWREITLPWIRVRHHIAAAALQLPYGSMQQLVDVRCGGIPREVIREFVSHAREACPQEVAGVFLWHEPTDTWRYQQRKATSSGTAHVNFEEVRPLDGEHLVIDVHSHGRHPAFFSSEDNADDAGAMKFSLVLGNLDNVHPTSSMRLCMAGLVMNEVRLDDDGLLEVA